MGQEAQLEWLGKFLVYSNRFGCQPFSVQQYANQPWLCLCCPPRLLKNISPVLGTVTYEFRGTMVCVAGSYEASQSEAWEPGICSMSYAFPLPSQF